MFLLQGEGKHPKLKTRLCCVQSPSETHTHTVYCLNTQNLRQHFLPSQISEGFLGNSQYLHSGSRSPGSCSSHSSSSAHPQLQLLKKLGFKATTARSTPCPALFESNVNFKAAPPGLALAGRARNVGGRGVAIPACILMFHPATHPGLITEFSTEINSSRGFFVDFRARRLKVSCVVFDFFL